MLNISILNLASEGGLDLIKSSNNDYVPSHIFYADDILILHFSKMSSIHSLKRIFHNYTIASDQKLNLSKSPIYYGFISNSYLNRILTSTSLFKGTFPFYYLGVLIFIWKGDHPYSNLPFKV